MTKNSFDQRKNRVRRKIGLSRRPRLSVFRSNKYIYAQVIDDEKGKTLVSVKSKHSKSKIDEAGEIGEKLAAMAKKKGIGKVVFDRGARRYHGRVKALAEGARKGGLNF